MDLDLGQSSRKVPQVVSWPLLTDDTPDLKMLLGKLEAGVVSRPKWQRRKSVDTKRASLQGRN